MGASSIYIGQESSMKQKPRVELDFGVAKNEGMMENLLISAESQTVDSNVSKIRRLIKTD